MISKYEKWLIRRNGKYLMGFGKDMLCFVMLGFCMFERWYDFFWNEVFLIVRKVSGK